MPRGIYDRKPKRKGKRKLPGVEASSLGFRADDRPSRTLRPQAGDFKVDETSGRLEYATDQDRTISGLRDEISMLNKEIGILRADQAESAEEIERLRRMVDKLLEL